MSVILYSDEHWFLRWGQVRRVKSPWIGLTWEGVPIPSTIVLTTSDTALIHCRSQGNLRYSWWDRNRQDSTGMARGVGQGDWQPQCVGRGHQTEVEWEEVGETCLERVWWPLYRDLLRQCWDCPGRGCLKGYLCSQDTEELQRNRMREAEIEGGLDALRKIENCVRPGPLCAGWCGPLVLTLEATLP